MNHILDAILNIGKTPSIGKWGLKDSNLRKLS